MRVFVTGATGFIGSAVVAELIDGLRSAAAEADGVVHTAYVHDFSQMEAAAQTDLRAIETFGEALAGSGRPLVITTGTALIRPGTIVTEDDSPMPEEARHPRFFSERAAVALAERSVRSSVVRPGASVHGVGDHGFVPRLIEIARERGASGYIGDGANRWPAVHRFDAARLYRSALESAPAGSIYHAIGDEGVPTREIAEVIGRHLDLPTITVAPADAAEHFGWLGAFFALDAPASSALTQSRLGWAPREIGLMADLEAGHYFAPLSVAV
jgi:nucleoside-diphosphate-sugar epimerase